MNHSITPVTLSLICAGSFLLYACGSVDTTESDISQKPSQHALHKQPVQQQQTEKKLSRDALAPVKARAKYVLAESAAMGGLVNMPSTIVYSQPVEDDRENYKHFIDSDIFKTSDNAVSTFSVDVDTGAYSNVRRFLNQGQLPRKDAVRAEELINYFSYNYKYPENKNQPFTINTEIAPTPWNKNSYLLHIGLQAYQAHNNEQRPPANLVFLVDVSGSMHSRDKLQLLKSGLKLLVNNLGENDSISIVTYAGSTGVVLKPTKGNKTAEISVALDRLTAGGSTNGASGIELAYQMAQQSFIKNGVNRIVLATDGDFNVGVTNFNALKEMVEKKRKSGVSLTTLGFGRGNYNDHLMEQLADAGNGNYSYIDNLNEARKVLVEEMNSTLNTVANDVKIQIEFNPHQIAEYRLIGYENRALKQQDFNNDKVDAGDIGENHTVTALYEITFTDSLVKQFDAKRYEKTFASTKRDERNNELAFLRLRYKADSKAKSQLIEKPVYKNEIIKNISQASNNFKFSASVAAFAQQLRGGKHLHEFSYNDILKLAKRSKGKDTSGYRGEFIQLVSLAKALDS